MTDSRSSGGAVAGAADTRMSAVPPEHPRPPRGPLVTVGLPVYNGGDYLVPAMESILAQDYDHLHVVIADNGSTDQTREICREFARRDSRVDYHRSPVTRGAAWNYNRIVHIAEGEYFKWAAHDDICGPSFIGRCVTELEKASGSVVLAYPRASIIDVDGVVIGDFDDNLDLREQHPHERLRHFFAWVFLAHPVFGLIRTTELHETEMIGGYAGSDIVLLMQLALRGQFLEVADRLFFRRLHAGASVTANPRPRDLLAWFDPARKRRPFPRTEMILHMVASVHRDECLDATERARCLAELSRYWVRRYALRIGREFGIATEDHASRVPTPTPTPRAGRRSN